MHPQIVQAIGMPGTTEWIIILIIMLLLFGSRLPKMMRGMGGSIKEFKKGMEDGDDEKAEKVEKKIAAPEGTASRDSALSTTAKAKDDQQAH